MTSTLKRYASFTAHEKPTVGDSKISYISSDHLGWILCDGRELSVSDYYLLWSVIGYSFGGSGTTFNLPAAAGRVPGISGTGVGLTPRVTGDMVGTETHTLTIAEMPAHKHGSADVLGDTNGNGFTSINATGITINAVGDHTHNITDPGHAHSYFNQPQTHDVAVSLTTTDTADNVNVNQTSGSSTTGITIVSAGGHTHTITDPGHQHTLGSTGGSTAHENMQPTIFMGNMFIYSGIPTLGVWPYTTGFKVK
jgi:microcystin-dependent protein